MKVLIWHGYLLGGTGSNVYTRSLARAWSRLGHDVVVFCQDPEPGLYDLGGARAVRPALPGPLPVFVLDRYADLEARRLQDLTPAQRADYVAANAAAVRAELPADFLLVNHVLPGAAVGAAAGTPFTVKAHGSELEFSLRGDAELRAWARTALAGARELLVGSEHLRGVVEEVVGPVERVRVVPPGVDVEALAPEPRAQALARLVAEAERDGPPRSERDPDAGNADRLAAFLTGDEPTVVYVGKLSAEKGVHLLLEALARLPHGRAVIVGFGPARSELEEQARRLFADRAKSRIAFTGPLEHRHLAHLWPLADVSVVPSVFPEAFGMVAAEAAACGSRPLVARHSGLAEVAAGVAAEYPPEHRELASFASGDADDLAAKLTAILSLPPADRQLLGSAARRAAVSLWSWERVAYLILSHDG